MAQLNTWADVSALANNIQSDVYFVARAANFMQGLVSIKNDTAGMAPRKNYEYNAGVADDIGESDDLTGDAFTPSVLSTLTPGEIGEQFVLTDQRLADSATIADIRNDAARELGFAASDKVEADLLGDFRSLTGGTIGASGSAMTWGYLFAAATVARVSIKRETVPLYAVLHEYQWHVLAKAASVAGTSIAQAPQFTDSVMATWYRGTVAGINLFVTPNSNMLVSTDAYGAVFAKEALALDWRRPIRIEPERDASRRCYEFNMSAVFAHGVWRPTWGVQLISAATAPTS